MNFEDHDFENFEKFNKLMDEMLYPPNFIKIFPTMDSFRNWISLGEKEDMETILKLYEEHELYEHCVIIKEEIHKK